MHFFKTIKQNDVSQCIRKPLGRVVSSSWLISRVKKCHLDVQPPRSRAHRSTREGYLRRNQSILYAYRYVQLVQTKVSMYIKKPVFPNYFIFLFSNNKMIMNDSHHSIRSHRSTHSTRRASLSSPLTTTCSLTSVSTRSKGREGLQMEGVTS